jgi:PAS domain S-box-containing protein
MSAPTDAQKRIEILEQEVARLQKVNEVLMNRVERSTEEAGSAYSLFESNLLLQNKVREHTENLTVTNRNLAREIVERRKTERALRWERNFIEAVLETAGALIIVLDTEARIVRFNRSCERASGYGREEVEGMPFWMLLPEEDKERIQGVFGDLTEKGIPNQAENYWVSKTGERRLIAWSNTTLRDVSGNVEYVVGTGIDITDHREADERLRLYHRIFTASSEPITIVDHEGRVIERNPAHREMSGLSDPEILGRSIAEQIGEGFYEKLQQSIARSGRFRGEVDFRSKDAYSHTVDLSVFPVHNEADEFLCYVGIGKDITDRKRDQEALARRLRYEIGLAACSRTLIETRKPKQVLPEAMGKLLEAIEASRAFLFENFEDPELGLCMRLRFEVTAQGVAPQLQNPVFQRLPYTDDIGPWREIFERNLTFGGPTSTLPPKLRSLLESTGAKSIFLLPVYVNGDGYGLVGFSEIWTAREWGDAESRLLRTAADMIGGFLARRRAEQDLRSSEERFRLLVENSNNVIYSLNPRGELTYLSPKFRDYSGRPVEEDLGRSVTSLVYEEDARVFEKWLEEGVAKGEDRRQGLLGRFLDPEGNFVWFVSNASAVRNPTTGEVDEIVGVAHDITELKKVMEDLEKANRNLRLTQAQLVQSEKMASLGMLVAGIAHEINTPIGAIGSMHDSLVRAVGKLEGALKSLCPPGDSETARINQYLTVIGDAIRVIDSGTDRVTNIVRRLRSFARLDEAELKEADIHEGIEDTLTLVHHEIKHTITVHREYGEVPAITVYPSRLNQVFLNILINAKQAIQGEGEITIRTYRRGEKVYAEFTDTGVGIPEERLKRIFDPGFTTKGVGVGTGLGLSICYQIMQDHHGEIQVHSEVGKGTTFTMILPVDLAGILEQQGQKPTT